MYGSAVAEIGAVLEEDIDYGGALLDARSSPAPDMST